MKKVLFKLNKGMLGAVIVATLFSGSALAAPFYTVSNTKKVKTIHTLDGRTIKKTTHTKVVKKSGSKQVKIYKTIKTETKPKILPVAVNNFGLVRTQFLLNNGMFRQQPPRRTTQIKTIKTVKPYARPYKTVRVKTVRYYN